MASLWRAARLKIQRVFFNAGRKRELCERIDTHKLFLYTSFHEQQQLGQLPADLSQQLIEQAKSLPWEQQKQVVQQQLTRQLVSIASCIHGCLTQHGDAAPAATALQQTLQDMQRHEQQLQQHTSRLGGLGAAAAAAAPGTSPGGAGARRVLSQQQLSELVQQRLGYSLAVRPSLINHQAAGLGLFVEGHAPPGALVALFPGLVYRREVYRRMAGYPRIDKGNPYLTSRYDGGIVDSLPWGRGWLADGQQVAAPIVLPARVGLMGRMAAASDGPRMPIPDTTWVKATTGEAAALEMLEGRHPLALAHYANHPPAGARPNTAIASFTFRPAGCVQQQQPQQDHAAGQAAGSSGSDAWARAYVPNISYTLECDRKHLLTHEVSCVGLVAVEALPPGTELLFNYRLSPSIMGRPAWYVPVDGEEENMRWA